MGISIYIVKGSFARVQKEQMKNNNLTTYFNL